MAERRVRVYQDERQAAIDQRVVERVTTGCRYLNEDPKFNVTKPEGKALQAKWKGNVLLTDAYQGSGKSCWMNQITIDHQVQHPSARILHLAPFTTLTTGKSSQLNRVHGEWLQQGLFPADQAFRVHA